VHRFNYRTETNESVEEVLLDQRKGQANHLLVDSQIKAELVQQFAARSIAGYPISERALADAVNVLTTARKSGSSNQPVWLRSKWIV